MVLLRVQSRLQQLRIVPTWGFAWTKPHPWGPRRLWSRWITLPRHDGSSATLLLGESLLTNPTSGTQVFIPRVDNTSSGSPKPSWGKWTTPPKMSTTTPATNAGNVLTYATSGLYTSTTYPGSATNDMEAAVGFEWSEWSATPTLTDKLLSRHPGGVVVSFCDGHQQFIANTVSVTTFAMLMTPYGNGIPMSGNAMATTLPWDGCPGTALAIPSPPVPLPTASAR